MGGPIRHRTTPIALAPRRVPAYAFRSGLDYIRSGRAMTEAEALEWYGLPPAISDLPAIRALLIEETERCRANRGDEPLLRLYCLMLFSRGDVNDALPIWRAKMSNFDAGFGIDIQFV
jgi:hypothetical protein